MSFPQQTTTAKEISGADLASYKNIKAQIATEISILIIGKDIFKPNE